MILAMVKPPQSPVLRYCVLLFAGRAGIVSYDIVCLAMVFVIGLRKMEALLCLATGRFMS